MRVRWERKGVSRSFIFKSVSPQEISRALFLRTVSTSMCGEGGEEVMEERGKGDDSEQSRAEQTRHG